MKLEKITNRSARPGGSQVDQPPHRRRYEDACGAAHALDLVGERWALLVVRELMFGPKRFGALRADLPGISANVLTQRLEGLEAAGILTRRKLPPPANTQVYELTRWGYESEPIFQSLGRWAARSPLHDPTLPISPVSLMLSFRTMFDPEQAMGLAMTAGFVFGAETFVARVSDGRIEIVRGDVAGCDVVFTGSAGVVAAVAYGGADFNGLTSGDPTRVKTFLRLFSLPPKAPP